MVPVPALRPNLPVGSPEVAEVAAAADAAATEVTRIPRAMMIGCSPLLLFVTGAAILLVIPGPAVTYVVSRSIGQARTAGLMSAMWISVAPFFCAVAVT